MTPRRLRSAAIVCAIALLAGGALSGCGKRELKTGREGQGIKVGGVTYNVYITRQLNPRDAEDSAYTAGIRTDQPGYYFYGVFLTASEDAPLTPRAFVHFPPLPLSVTQPADPESCESLPEPSRANTATPPPGPAAVT